jgi:hypothetical protein
MTIDLAQKSIFFVNVMNNMPVIRKPYVVSFAFDDGK